MMNIKIFTTALCILLFSTGYTQEKKDSLLVRLHLNFRNESLELNKKYISDSKDTLQIEVFRFYISNIKLHYSDESTYSEENSYHLIDIENPNSLQIPILKKSEKTITKVAFSIGVDSLASVSGAMSGDLDPTKGMYWAWQSGFINMKIEGTSSSCKTRKNKFQFHIGGYLRPNYAIRKININRNFSSKNQIDLVMDLSKLFEEINLLETNSIMIPGEKAMQMADLSCKMFYIE